MTLHEPPDLEGLLAQATWVQTLARRLVADSHQAEDIVQDAMLAGLRSGPRRESGWRAWLATVVRNLSRFAARQAARRGIREHAAARSEEELSTQEVIERVERQRIVAQAVLELDEPYRETLLLRFYQELAVGEIARRQAVPAKTVDTRLRRGLGRLRQKLESRMGTECLAEMLAALATAPPMPCTASAPGFTLVKTGQLIRPLKLAVVAALCIVAIPLTWRFISTNQRATPEARRDGSESPPRPTIGAKFSATEAALTPRASGSSTATRTETMPGFAVAQGAGARLVVHVVWDEDGAPIAGVPVKIGMTLAGGASTEVTSTSDDEGQASIDVTAPAEVSAVELAPTSSCPPYATHDHPFVGADDRVDLTLRVPHGGSMSGLVVDSQGLPVPAAQVRAWMGNLWEVTEEVMRSPHRITTTDTEGHFLLEHLLGNTTVSAGAPGLRSTYLVNKDIQPGQTLSQVKLELSAVFRTLNGQVVNENGEGIEGAKVRVEPLGSQALVWRRDLGVHHYLGQAVGGTDADGRFSISTPSPAALRVKVFERDHEGATVEVEAGATAVTITLESGVTVRGEVRDRDGKPVAGAEVCFGVSKATSDAAGQFRLEPMRSIAPAEGRSLPFVATAPGYALCVVEVDRIDKDLPPLAFVLEPGLTISGRVLSEQNAPVPCAHLELSGTRRLTFDHTHMDGSARTWEEVAHCSQLVTQVDGSFCIDNLYPGSFRIKVEPPGMQNTKAYREVAAGSEGVEIRLGSGLDGLVTLRGRVFDVKTREPVEDFQVVTDRMVGLSSALAHYPYGTFTTEPFEPDTPIRLWLFTPDLKLMTRMLVRDLTAGVHDIDCALAFRVVSLRVLDAAGVLVSGCAIEVHDTDDRRMGMYDTARLGLWATSVTDEKGVAQLSLPVSGIAYVAVAPGGDQAAIQRFPLDLTKPLEGIVDIHLR